MRAVTVAVDGVAVGHRNVLGRVAGVVGVAHEVPASLDARGAGAEPVIVRRVAGSGRCEGLLRAGAAEGGMGVVDAGVDDGHLDAGTGVTVVLPHLIHAEVGDGGGVGGLCELHPVHRRDAGQLGQRRRVLAGHAHLDAVVGGLDLGAHLAAELRDGGLELVLLGLALGLECLALRLAEACRGCRVDDGDGLGGQLDHDGHARGTVGGGRHEVGGDLAAVGALEPVKWVLWICLGRHGDRQGDQCGEGDGAYSLHAFRQSLGGMPRGRHLAATVLSALMGVNERKSRPQPGVEVCGPDGT